MQEYSILFIASEQVFPHLEAIIHYRDTKLGLRSIEILHSSSSKSEKPARQIERLLTKINLQGAVHVNSHLIGVRSQDVAEKAREILDAAPPDREWVINATGGLKMMAFGLLSAIDRPGVTLIYAEFGQWWQISEKGDLRQYTAEKCLVPPLPDDAIPVLEFLRCQDLDHPGLTIQGRNAASFRLPAGTSLTDMLANVAANKWKWNLIPFQAEQDGFAFEWFIGAFLCEIGVANILGNLKANHPTNKTPAGENDLFALHGGQIHFLDVSLAQEGTKNKPAAITQINDASERARNFGGSRSACIMIRPSEDWNSLETIQIVASAKNVVILDKGICHSRAGLFGSLAAHFNIAGHPLPGKLDEIISDFRRRGLGAITSSRLPINVESYEPESRCMLDLPHIDEHFFKDCDLPVYAITIGSQAWVRWQALSERPNVARQFLESKMKSFGLVSSDFKVSGSEVKMFTLHVTFLPTELIPILRKWIKEIAGKTLDEILVPSQKSSFPNQPRKAHSATFQQNPLPVPPLFSVGQRVPGALVEHPLRPETGRIYFAPDGHPELAGNTGKKVGQDSEINIGDQWNASLITQSPPTFSLVSRVPLA